MRNHTATYSLLAVLKNSMQMEHDHFCRDLSRRRARGLFRRHVELIEIETTSYCNRTCSFCPNSLIDRRSDKLYMPDDTWDAIVGGLREVNYARTLVWSRYSEPLSERRILQRIREVRAAAPRARICVNSNGDYLDAEYVRELHDACLDRLWVDIYIPDDEDYNSDVAHEYNDRFLRRVRRHGRVIATTPELTCSVDCDGLEMTTHVRNLAVLRANDMSGRGGLIQIARKTIRQAPCYAPFKHLVVDWDGSLVVCCQLRSDSVKHADAVLGRIGMDMGLVDAYVQLAGWRQSLQRFGEKSGPCATCNVFEYDATLLNRAIARVLTTHIPGVMPVGGILSRVTPTKLRY
jgi:Radical SAM superfamily